jgi:REP element-mobilizing transposase RayT
MGTGLSFYYVHIPARGRETLASRTVNGVAYTPIGALVEKLWRKLGQGSSRIAIDTFSIEPDHLQGIVVATGGVDLPRVIESFTADTARQAGKNVWRGTATIRELHHDAANSVPPRKPAAQAVPVRSAPAANAARARH